MRKIRTLIVDDEPLAREGIALMLGQDPEVEIIGACADGTAAIEEIRSKRPSLVFMDVQMPLLDGIETFKALAPEIRPAVVFVTAYDKYAVQAFEAAAVDYILKPFRDTRFRAALDRAKERVRRADLGEMESRAKALLEHLHALGLTGEPPVSGSSSQQAVSALPTPPAAGGATAPAASRVRFKTGGDWILLDPTEIVWVEAQGDLVKVCAGGQTHLARESLQSVESRLEAGLFARVHRSFIVNTERVRKIASALYGDYTLSMSDGTKIPLSRNYRDRVKALLQSRIR